MPKLPHFSLWRVGKVLAVLLSLALAKAPAAPAQSTYYTTEDLTKCPRAIPNAMFWWDTPHLFLIGTAELTMVQWDGTTTYQWTGYTLNWVYKATGFINVPPSECAGPAASYWLFLPYPIPLLSHARLFKYGIKGYACNDPGGGDPLQPVADVYEAGYDPDASYSATDGEWIEVGSEPECDDEGGGESPEGSGGTWPGPGGSVCHSEHIVIEISDDGGQTWRIYWEGEATVCK